MNKLKEFLKTMKQRGLYSPENITLDELPFGEHVEKVMQEMLNTITKVPHISSIKGISPIYNSMKAISISCLSAVFVYKSLKLMFSDDVNGKVESKKIFSRLAYSLVLSNASMPIIDMMIDFNNNLIGVLLKNFTIMPILGKKINKTYGIVISIILLLLELFCTLKIMIQYWMRMSELVFTGVISPIIFTMWINDQWSGFLSQWWKRVSMLIFTQFFQILILVLYSMLISGLALSGTFNGICLAIGSLLLLCETPKVLSGFMDTGNNASRITDSLKKIKSKGLRKLFK